MKSPVHHSPRLAAKAAASPPSYSNLNMDTNSPTHSHTSTPLYKRKSTQNEDTTTHMDSLTPKHKHTYAHTRLDDMLDFGGPIGAMILSIMLPITMLILNIGADIPYESNFIYKVLKKASKTWGLSNMFHREALFYLFVWLLFQLTLKPILPGEECSGVTRKDKTRKPLLYKLNGHLSFWVSVLFVSSGRHFIPDYKLNLHLPFDIKFTRVYDIWLELYVVCVAFFTLKSVILLIYSHRYGDVELSETGERATNIFTNFWMGRELNPRLFGLDLKFFFEMKHSLIGWCIGNIMFATKQYEKYGYVSTPMILTVCFQGMYVWDALFKESCILTTMDITSEGLGYMLAFGNGVWVPFGYTLQAHYLVNNSSNLSTLTLLGLTCLHFAGYAIFRLSNSQKDLFRRDPNHPSCKSLRTFHTSTGRRLLVSGWWGWARKINYTGDWLMSLSWCLLCGFDSPIPYFYCVYFFFLLLHRAWRDDVMCSRKYGDDWVKYKRMVPYVFVPHVI